MKTLLILIVLLTITGCATAPQEQGFYSLASEIDRDRHKLTMDKIHDRVTPEQYKERLDIIGAKVDKLGTLVGTAGYVGGGSAASSAVMMETGARLLGGGGYGYNQPVRMQTTCTQIGMFTQCW